MVSVNQRSHHWGGTTLWVLSDMGPKWMVLEDPTKKDDLLVPPFQDTSIYIMYNVSMGKKHGDIVG